MAGAKALGQQIGLSVCGGFKGMREVQSHRRPGQGDTETLEGFMCALLVPAVPPVIGLRLEERQSRSRETRQSFHSHLSTLGGNLGQPSAAATQARRHDCSLAASEGRTSWRAGCGL